MSDPTTTPPLPPAVPPAPDARPFAPEKVGGGGGCQKPLLIGCGLVALLVGIGAVVFVMKAKDVLAYAMNQLRAQVVAHLPEETSDADRQRLEAGFDGTLARIRGGEIDPAALQELQKRLSAAASAAGSRRLTTDELDGLIEALEKFNGVRPEDDSGAETGGAVPEEEAAPASESAAGGSAPEADAARPPAP